MQHRLSALLLALPVLLGAGGTVQRPHNVLVGHLRTEPVVAVDPADPSLVVAGSNTDYIPQPNGSFPVPYFTSHDGGRTFSTGTLPLPAPYTTGADTSVAIAPDGTVFYSYLAESQTYCASGPGAILLAHSIDRGISFRGPVVVDSNAADDRPTLALETVPGQSTHILIAWTRSYPDHEEIWYARSVDGGATFSPARMLYTSSNVNFGAQPVIGPQDQVYVVWLSHPHVGPHVAGTAQVLVTASADDGVHFGAVRGAGRSFVTLPLLSQPGSLRDLTAPSATVSPAGILYVAYAAVADRHPDGSVDADIWLTHSLDRGTTWQAPVRVNDVRRGDRFMPALAELADGSLGVAFYDRRAGPGELDVEAARISFSGHVRVSQNVRVNANSSPTSDISYFHDGDACLPSGRFFGDYIGVAAAGTGLGVAWTDTQLQKPNETDLWFAHVTLPGTGQHAARVIAHTGRSGRTTGLGALVSPLAGLIQHTPLGGMSRTQTLLVWVLLLLPVLTIASAVRSLRTSSGY